MPPYGLSTPYRLPPAGPTGSRLRNGLIGARLILAPDGGAPWTTAAAVFTELLLVSTPLFTGAR
jgi:hypothetical protein